MSLVCPNENTNAWRALMRAVKGNRQDAMEALSLIHI